MDDLKLFLLIFHMLSDYFIKSNNNNKFTYLLSKQYNIQLQLIQFIIIE